MEAAGRAAEGGGQRLRRAAGVCGVAAALWPLATALAGGAARPGYSHATQFLSELGETGSAHGALVSWAGFAPTGLLVLAFLALAVPALPRARQTLLGVAGLGAVGAAYLVSASARCDPGCPASGSPAQAVHNAFGLLEYAGATAGLLALGGALRRAPDWRPLALLAFACAGLVALGFAAMLAPALAPARGVSQRVAEAGIFLWIASLGAALLRAPRIGG